MIRRNHVILFAFALLAGFGLGCVAAARSSPSSPAVTAASKRISRATTDGAIQILLDGSAPAYLVGKTLNLPPPIEGPYTRLVSIPSVVCRGGVSCAPCNSLTECDVMPPVEPGMQMLVEEGWIDEPGGTRTVVQVVSTYVAR